MGEVLADLENQRYQEAYEFLKSSIEKEIQRVGGLFWRGRRKASAMQEALAELCGVCEVKSARDRFEYCQQQLALPASRLCQSLNQQRLPFASAKPTKSMGQVAQALHQANRKAYAVRGHWSCPAHVTPSKSSSVSGERVPLKAFNALTWSMLRDFLKKYDEKKRWWNWDSGFIKYLKKTVNYFVDKGEDFSLSPPQQRSQLTQYVRALQAYPRDSLTYQFCAELLEYVLPGTDLLCLDTQDTLQLNSQYAFAKEKDLECCVRKQYSERSLSAIANTTPVAETVLASNQHNFMRTQAPDWWESAKVVPWVASETRKHSDSFDPIMHEPNSEVCSEQATPQMLSRSMSMDQSWLTMPMEEEFNCVGEGVSRIGRHDSVASVMPCCLPWEKTSFSMGASFHAYVPCQLSGCVVLQTGP